MGSESDTRILEYKENWNEISDVKANTTHPRTEDRLTGWLSEVQNLLGLGESTPREHEELALVGAGGNTPSSSTRHSRDAATMRSSAWMASSDRILCVAEVMRIGFDPVLDKQDMQRRPCVYR
ncbi:hypothetical protein AC578_7751 [Pseudocercospora eumusae]|uniref:Uncharacterized protein n=1 Tax=Pseudocercospora eumusae TaxID=321146 RepID=A0A139HKP5_9PEZI|nr:hypothetical protein AC578_7751 [Pseudocercospora eumusae]